MINNTSESNRSSEHVWFLVTRIIVGLLVSGVSVFLIQIAIFRYTRSEGIFIPASEIFNIVGGGASKVVSITSFIVLLIFIVSQFLFTTTSHTSKSSSTRPSNSWSYLRFAVVLVVCIPIVFCVFPSLTASALRFLGQGGGVDIWLYTEENINSDNAIQRDFEKALSEDNIKTVASLNKNQKGNKVELMSVPRKEPVLMPSTNGVPWKVFGKLLLLTKSHAYVELSKTSVILYVPEAETVTYDPHTIYRVSRDKINLTDFALGRQ